MSDINKTTVITDCEVSLDCYDQIKDNLKNTTKVVLSIDNIPDKADIVRIDGMMVFNDVLYKEFSVCESAVKIKQNNNSLTIDTTAFGKWDITISMLRDDKILDSYKDELIVTSDIYNMAFIEASLPTLIYTLKMMNGSINHTEDGRLIPSIITLIRYDTYDWERLPENVYACPYIDNKKVDTWGKYYHFCHYARELYRLNPESKFIFYFTDCFMYFELPQFLWIKNPIPEKNYTVRLISDGGLSYLYFKSAYDGKDDTMAIHQKMVDYLNIVRLRARETGELKTDDEPFGKGNLAVYVYAMLDVIKDSQWWLVRKNTDDTLAIKDKLFSEKIMKDERITENNINILLSDILKSDKAKQFKSLYKFDDEIFNTVKNNKKIMMILGSTKKVEDVSPVKPYIEILRKLYKDEFVYLYKEHPAYPFELNPEKNKELEEMGLMIIDSSIAAELLIYYHPEIYLSGYFTSTFLNSGSEKTNIALFNMGKTNALQRNDISIYAKDMKIFITDLKHEQSNDYRYYIRWRMKNKNHKYYLIEYINSNRIAIYDVDDDTFKYFNKGIDFKVSRKTVYLSIAAVMIIFLFIILILIRLFLINN